VTMNSAPKTTSAKKSPMIAVDTNILIYAWSKESPWHQEAAELMDRLEFGTTEWAIPNSCLCEFYQSVTSLKKLENPATPKEALERIEFWLALPHVAVLCEITDEDYDHWACFTDILEYTQIKGLDVFDAHVAAICITHGVGEFWTLDKGYRRFKGLKARNPFTAESRAGVFAEQVSAE
jgi:uncharacterized protein